MKRLGFFVLFWWSCIHIQAQMAVLNNKGALIHSNPSAIIKVKGSFLNDSFSTFTNHGVTTIDSTYTNDALTHGNGIYNVGKHWENNGTFIGDTSQVILSGDHQLITGSSETFFYTLELQNSGIKRQTLNAYTTHKLKLNDRELATDSFDMTVTNPLTNAITRTTGYVSSLDSGRLVRHTNSTGIYLFPTGSSTGVNRYRPVELKPFNLFDTYYGVRLANYQATLDGLDINNKDSVVCEINPLYYHLVEKRSGTVNADVRVYYDPIADGGWDDLAYWDHLVTAQWEDVGATTSGTSGLLNYVAYANWNQWQFMPIVLSKERPGIPQILGDTLVCGGYTTLYEGVSNITPPVFHWNLSGGGTIIDTTVNPISIDWGSGSSNHSLQLTQVAPNGCASYPQTIFIDVNPQPVANFSATPSTVLGSIPVTFTDSSLNAAYWNWNFGNGNTSSETDPQHIYNAEGSYTVTLIIESAEGCFDTAYTTINVIDGLTIPNVFTPNGDGANDLFEINGTNFKNFDATIFDRWGLLVFESSSAQVSWNGKTLTGSWATEGTYFLTLKITLLDDSVVTYSGFLNLFY